MMTRNQSNERGQLEMLTIDQLVPEDQHGKSHFLLRNLKKKNGKKLRKVRQTLKQGQVLKYTTITKEDIGNINQIQRFVQNIHFYRNVRKAKTIKSLYNVIFGKLT